MLTIKKATEDLFDRMLKQIIETIWTIKRIEPMSQKEVEKFQGTGTIKKKLQEELKSELIERIENIKIAALMINLITDSVMTPEEKFVRNAEIAIDNLEEEVKKIFNI